MRREHGSPDDAADLEHRLAELPANLDRLGGCEEERREQLLEAAEDLGLERVAAGEVYDLSVEEEVAPAYGLTLAVSGVAVQLLDGARPDVDTSEPSEPEWVDTPPGPNEARRERRLRRTLRRLRSILADADSPEAALRTFAREPDLERYEY